MSERTPLVAGPAAAMLSTEAPAVDGEAEEDRVLVDRVRAGSEEAFERIVQKYWRRVVGLCRSFCGNVEDAHDIAQEAFVTAYERLGTFRGTGRFSSWLFRVAVNRSLDHGRQAARRPRRQLLTDVMAAGLQAPRERMAEDERGEEALALLIADVVGGLADKYRIPLVLYYREKIGYAEIAERLEMPIGTVKTLLHRGRMRALQEFRVAAERHPGLREALS